MDTVKYKTTKRACYFSYLSMSSAFCLPPMLFLMFHDTYGISYTLLGTLVLINYCTQLTVDLIFSFFSSRFNIKTVVRTMPLLTSLGFVIYAIAPYLFKDSVYLCLAVGTVIFSVASGLSEVLVSPIVAAIPDSTAKDMSMLHSLYAIGVVITVGISVLFFNLFGKENWQILILCWAALPIIASFLYFIAPFPPMTVSHGQNKNKSNIKGLLLCVLCIFLGSAAESTMTTWISSYMETALGIDKTLGDILGMAMFAAVLWLGRVIYSKFGGKIEKTLLLGMIGAAVCYLTAGLSQNVYLSFLACVITGFCTSMLWPGSLIFMEEKINGIGIVGYALMAAGGDFGASVSPQLLGWIVDRTSQAQWAKDIAERLLVTPDQIGMRVGMIIASAFPILGIISVLCMLRFFKNRD